ncbi:MAG: DNA repair protein RadA [Pseudomonadales bacterium]|nr:DNA repair protein RadA [Pseudomonadales bacterium]
MAKTQVAYVCSECGADYAKWQGRCTTCNEWNTLQTFRIPKQAGPSDVSQDVGLRGDAEAVQSLERVRTELAPRMRTGFGELDRVLGGGLVPGSVVLIGGDPGAGKSTLLLQVAARLSGELPCLYVSGEESIQQIATRASRLQIIAPKLRLVSATHAEAMVELVRKEAPRIVIVDSIQVVHTDRAESFPGSVTQVRESAALLTRLAKQSNAAFVLVGHVTKEGSLAGPKTLEHMIDCSLMLDAPAGSRYRTLRSVKNRFGAVNEISVFAMTDHGLREVRNPSAIFLERSGEPAAGSVVTTTWEGTRPLLVEIQALVDDAQAGYPRRVAVGLDQHRLTMLLAVLHRHCGISIADQDVFANVTGGVRVAETGADLALLASVYSSFRNCVLPSGLVVFGELGLTSEVRPVANGQERIAEATKHGFDHAIVPDANRPRTKTSGMRVDAVSSLKQALDLIHDVAGNTD